MEFNTKILSATAAVIALGTALATPALARDHDYDRDYERSRHYGRYKHYRQVQNRAIKNSYKAQVYDWNTERGLYNRHWNRMSATNRRALDAQMRAQWRAYHNNNWNGAYSWNNYNDPAFMDYLHNRNPGLLTNLRTSLGF